MIKIMSSDTNLEKTETHNWWSQEHRGLMVQQYIAKPLLFDEMKFKFRVYVTVTNVSPLRAYLFSDESAMWIRTHGEKHD